METLDTPGGPHRQASSCQPLAREPHLEEDLLASWQSSVVCSFDWRMVATLCEMISAESHNRILGGSISIATKLTDNCGFKGLAWVWYFCEEINNDSNRGTEQEPRELRECFLWPWERGWDETPSCKVNIETDSSFLFHEINLILVLYRSRVIVKFNLDLRDFYLLVGVGHLTILMV